MLKIEDIALAEFTKKPENRLYGNNILTVTLKNGQILKFITNNYILWRTYSNRFKAKPSVQETLSDLTEYIKAHRAPYPLAGKSEEEQNQYRKELKYLNRKPEKPEFPENKVITEPPKKSISPTVIYFLGSLVGSIIGNLIIWIIFW